MSPPLVAFRETVFCAAEAPEGVAGRAARVVEATTPNGCLTVRVRAHPLPGAIASALDEAQEQLRRALQSSQHSHSHGQQQAEQHERDGGAVDGQGPAGTSEGASGGMGRWVCWE